MIGHSTSEKLATLRWANEGPLSCNSPHLFVSELELITDLEEKKIMDDKNSVMELVQKTLNDTILI